MSHAKRHKRLCILEQHVANDPDRIDREAWNAYLQREREILIKLFQIFPEERHETLFNLIDQDQMGWKSEYRGLNDLCWRIHHKNLKPPLLPLAVADVYLNEPKASGWRCCIDCDLPIPYREGVWVNEVTKSWGGGEIRYFENCPACGGTVVRWPNKDPLGIYRGVSYQGTPNYVFQDDVPEWVKTKRP